MHDIAPGDFLNVIFPPGELFNPSLGPIRRVITSTNYGDFWRNRYWRNRRGLPVGTQATYYCVSTVAVNQEKPTRRLQDVQEAWVLVLDDVGTKAKPLPMLPSYILETSEGNFQHGYLINPFDVSTDDGKFEYDAVLYSLAEAGFNDPGCRSASRMVRLPGSLHSSGFTARLAHWAPERIWDLEHFLDDVRVERREPLRGSGELKAGTVADLVDVVDPVLAWMQAYPGICSYNDEWVYIECPWRDEHTNRAQGLTSTAYSPLDYGKAGRAFKCLHGHCAGRTTADFLAWVAKRGGPDVRREAWDDGTQLNNVLGRITDGD